MAGCRQVKCMDCKQGRAEICSPQLFTMENDPVEPVHVVINRWKGAGLLGNSLTSSPTYWIYANVATREQCCSGAETQAFLSWPSSDTQTYISSHQ